MPGASVLPVSPGSSTADKIVEIAMTPSRRNLLKLRRWGVKMGTRRNFLKIAGASAVASSTLPLESGAAAEPARKALVSPFQSPELVSLYETYTAGVGSSRVDLQACKLEYSIVSPK